MHGLEGDRKGGNPSACGLSEALDTGDEQCERWAFWLSMVHLDALVVPLQIHLGCMGRISAHPAAMYLGGTAQEDECAHVPQ